MLPFPSHRSVGTEVTSAAEGEGKALPSLRARSGFGPWELAVPEASSPLGALREPPGRCCARSRGASGVGSVRARRGTRRRRLEESRGDRRAQGELQGQPSLGAGPAVLNPCRKGSGPEGFCFIGVSVNSRLKALPGDACRAGPRVVTLTGFHSHSRVPFQAFFAPVLHNPGLSALVICCGSVTQHTSLSCCLRAREAGNFPIHPSAAGLRRWPALCHGLSGDRELSTSKQKAEDAPAGAV